MRPRALLRAGLGAATLLLAACCPAPALQASPPSVAAAGGEVAARGRIERDDAGRLWLASEEGRRLLADPEGRAAALLGHEAYLTGVAGPGGTLRVRSAGRLLGRP